MIKENNKTPDKNFEEIVKNWDYEKTKKVFKSLFLGGRLTKKEDWMIRLIHFWEPENGDDLENEMKKFILENWEIYKDNKKVWKNEFNE